MPTLAEQIHTRLNEDKTQEALRLLAESGHGDAHLLQDRYDRLLKTKTLGKISPEEWHVSISRIHFALLELSKAETPPPGPAGDLQAQTRQLLMARDTQSALRLLVTAGRPGAEAMLTRLTTAQAQYAVQEIDYSRWSQIHSGIAAEVLDSATPASLEKRRVAAPSYGAAAHAQPLTLREAAPLIRQAIRQGDTAAAIDLLLRTGAEQAPALHERFAAAGLQHAHGLIGPEEWGRTQAQICQSIFDLDWMQASEPSQVLPAGAKAQILRLLHERKTAQALTLCADISDQYLLFQAQLSAAKKQSDLGLIESDYLEITESRINYALQAWIGQSPESEVLADKPVTASVVQAPTTGIWNKVQRLWRKKP